MKKNISEILLLAGILFYNGCSQPTAPSLPKSETFKLGEQDGCTTAHGTYTKNSEMFKSDSDYQEGWFAGRKHCNPSFHKK